MKNILVSLILVLLVAAFAFAGAEGTDAAVESQPPHKSTPVSHKVRVEDQAPVREHGAAKDQKDAAQKDAQKDVLQRDLGHSGDVTIKGKAGMVTSVDVNDPQPAQGVKAVRTVEHQTTDR